jgi:Prohead core protein serine protease
MKLFTELNEEVGYLSETKENGEKEHYIHGIFLQANKKNRNNRIYPMHVMESEVNRYIKEVVKNNRAYGELGHPQGPQINLDRVSHIVTELKRDGDNFVGKAKLTDTPMGNIAKGLLNSGAGLGVSSRGLGTLKPTKDGIMEVQDDFRLATAADIVADPSAPDAYVKGIMENVDWVYDSVKGTWLEQQLEDEKKEIRGLSRAQIEEQKLTRFNNFIQSLKTI